MQQYNKLLCRVWDKEVASPDLQPLPSVQNSQQEAFITQCFLYKHLHRFCRTHSASKNVPAGMHKIQNMSESVFWLFLRNTLQAIKVINRKDRVGGEKSRCYLNPTLHAPVILQASFFKPSLHFPGFSHFSKGNELKVKGRCVVNNSYYHYRPKTPLASCNLYTKVLSLDMVYSMIKNRSSADRIGAFLENNPKGKVLGM